jgi:hypothetical protein
MIDVGLFMLIIWILKNAAEDTLATVKGQSNPRIERRRARQKSRANNPIWTQLVGWAGDIAEDARTDAADSRRRKREQRQRELDEAAEAEQAEREQARERAEAERAEREQADREQAEREQARERAEREQAEREQAEREQAEREQAQERAAGEQAEPEVDIPLDDPKEEEQQQEQGGSESASPDADSLPDNVIPFARPKKFDPKEYRMSTQVNGEVTGLDPAISYAKSLAMFAGEHGQAGNEGYIGFLQQSKVAGVALQSAHDMQEAFANAQAAAEKHRQELAKQKAVQEAFNTNPDAGDKQFQMNGQ